MRSKVLQRILDNTPKDVEIFVRLYADLVVRINQLLREKGITQKELADNLDKSPSEISKWLSGDHNFTLRSLAKLSAELGEPLLEVPVRNVQSDFGGVNFQSVTKTPGVNTEEHSISTQGNNWLPAKKIKRSSNVKYG